MKAPGLSGRGSLAGVCGLSRDAPPKGLRWEGRVEGRGCRAGVEMRGNGWLRAGGVARVETRAGCFFGPCHASRHGSCGGPTTYCTLPPGLGNTRHITRVSRQPHCWLYFVRLHCQPTYLSSTWPAWSTNNLLALVTDGYAVMSGLAGIMQDFRLQVVGDASVRRQIREASLTQTKEVLARFCLYSKEYQSRKMSSSHSFLAAGPRSFAA